MRHVIYGIRIILQLSGLMLTVTSWLVRNRGATVANALLIAGVVLLLAGMLIHRATRLKRCPRCAEKVRSESLRYSLCGYDFPATKVESVFGSFYK